MQRLFSGFPDGLRGAALLLLRCASALILLRNAFTEWESGGGTLLCVALALEAGCLCAGFMTPAMGLIAAILKLAVAISPGLDSWPFSLLAVCVLLVISALGPGAYSVDARVFGRRKVTIGTRPLRPN